MCLCAMLGPIGLSIVPARFRIPHSAAPDCLSSASSKQHACKDSSLFTLISLQVTHHARRSSIPARCCHSQDPCTSPSSTCILILDTLNTLHPPFTTDWCSHIPPTKRSTHHHPDSSHLLRAEDEARVPGSLPWHLAQ